MVVLSLISSIYNSQILAYTLHYLFASFANSNGLVSYFLCLK